jgi:prolipoprotein diacylglyceryltransferase
VSTLTLSVAVGRQKPWGGAPVGSLARRAVIARWALAAISRRAYQPAALPKRAVIVLPRYGIPLLKVGDAIAPTVGVGIAIARIGCFLEGCCYGTVCHLPWCLALRASR